MSAYRGSDECKAAPEHYHNDTDGSCRIYATPSTPGAVGAGPAVEALESGQPAGENEGHAVTPVWTACDQGAPRRQTPADVWDEALRWVRQQAEVTSPEYVLDKIDQAEPFNPYRAIAQDADRTSSAEGPWMAFPGKAPVCRDCGADWNPVRRGECSQCGSDAGPLETSAGGHADGATSSASSVRLIPAPPAEPLADRTSRGGALGEDEREELWRHVRISPSNRDRSEPLRALNEGRVKPGLPARPAPDDQAEGERRG